MKKRILKKAMRLAFSKPRSRLGKRYAARSNARFRSGYWPKR